MQASGLARHSRGLQPGARVGVLIHEPESPGADPLQTPRLTAQATVTVLDRESEAFERAREAFVRALPLRGDDSEPGDFNLYELEFGRGRYVAGFAQAYNLGPDTFRQVATLKTQTH